MLLTGMRNCVEYGYDILTILELQLTPVHIAWLRVVAAKVPITADSSVASEPGPVAGRATMRNPLRLMVAASVDLIVTENPKA